MSIVCLFSKADLTCVVNRDKACSCETNINFYLIPDKSRLKEPSKKSRAFIQPLGLSLEGVRISKQCTQE